MTENDPVNEYLNGRGQHGLDELDEETMDAPEQTMEMDLHEESMYFDSHTDYNNQKVSPNFGNLKSSYDSGSFKSPSDSGSFKSPSGFARSKFPAHYGSLKLPVDFSNLNVPEQFGRSNLSEHFGKSNLTGNFGNPNLSEHFGKSNISEKFGNPNLSEHFGKLNISEHFGKPNLSEQFGKSNLRGNFEKSNPSEYFGKTNISEHYGKPNLSEHFGKSISPEHFGKSASPEHFGKSTSPENFQEESMEVICGVPDISTFQHSKYYKTVFSDKAKMEARILKYSPPDDKDIYGRFYVHYKKNNSRMDEWISPSSYEMFANKPLPDSWIDYFLRTETFRTKDFGIKYIDKIVFGHFEIDTWYFSPYKLDINKIKITKMLYICEHCLKYTSSLKTYVHHVKACSVKVPPGKEIYKKDNLVVFEINGSIDKLFCQNLCLMSKLFMESKIRVYCVNYFLFYVFGEVDEKGFHIVGYFSKSKYTKEGNNLSCLMTLPPYQGKGYGKFMISFSYEIAKIENFIGTPEAPLSDLGKKTYLEYWSWTILHALPNMGSQVTVKQISTQTCIAENDVLEALKKMKLIISSKKSNICLKISQTGIKELIDSRAFKPPKIYFDRRCLKWKPEVNHQVV